MVAITLKNIPEPLYEKLKQNAALFWNVLALYLRQGYLQLEDAIQIHQEAETVIQPGEYAVDAVAILQLAHESGCSAYDCEYVASAQQLSVLLITADRRLLLFQLLQLP